MRVILQNGSRITGRSWFFFFLLSWTLALFLQGDFNVPDVPKSMAWCENSICVGFKRDYYLIRVKLIFCKYHQFALEKMIMWLPGGGDYVLLNYRSRKCLKSSSWCHGVCVCVSNGISVNRVCVCMFGWALSIFHK